MRTPVDGAKLLLTAGIALALAIGTLGAGSTAEASHLASVGLGVATPFAILAGTPNITNVPTSTITGNVGLSPATGAGIGLTCGEVSGTIYSVDAAGPLPCRVTDPGLLGQAKNALTTAIGDAAGRPGGLPVAANELAGKNLSHGVYNSAAAMALSGGGTLTLNGGGDPNAVFIFQLGTLLTVSNASTVQLTNQAQACNVFWQVDSADIGSTATFVGTILAATSITVGNASTVNGRLLAGTGNVTLISDTITRPTCAAAATPVPTGSPYPTPDQTLGPIFTAGPSVAPAGASPAASPAPTGSPTLIAILPSTATVEDSMLFAILPLLVIAFAVLYLVTRARRRRAPPAN